MESTNQTAARVVSEATATDVPKFKWAVSNQEGEDRIQAIAYRPEDVACANFDTEGRSCLILKSGERVDLSRGVASRLLDSVIHPTAAPPEHPPA